MIHGDAVSACVLSKGSIQGMSRTSQESNGDIGTTCKKLRTRDIQDIAGPLSAGEEAILINGPHSPGQENSHVIGALY